ncbi:ABC transporter permease [Abyssisolibacter fermentans]|uniref:ABC transporter permease n=1 Tax=Abyssisolibacter fermentans TaxID=1766203 RepID=UPI000829A571|nr:ABC transporter permease [Abyssisolibacter fermentans]
MKNVGLMKLIKVEFNKLKGTKLLIIFMIFPILFCSLGFMNVVRYKELFLANDPWSSIYEQNAIFYGGVFFPILIAIVVGAVTRVEYKNNNLKKILSLPVKRESLYMSKFIATCIIILINVLIFIAFIVISAVLLIHPEHIPSFIITSPLIAFTVSLPIVAIYYYLNIRFKNMLIPLILAVCLILPTMMINATKFWFIFPFAYPSHLIMAGTSFYNNSISISMIVFAIIIFSLFISMGIKNFKKMDIG